jgi:hypothetical protein
MIPPLMHLSDHSLYLPSLFAVDKRGRRLRRRIVLLGRLEDFNSLVCLFLRSE